MPASDRQLPHPATEDLVLTDVLAALADPARLAIVAQLAAGPSTDVSCADVGGAVPKSTRSHQLKTLREAGLLRNTPSGRQRLLALRREDLDGRWPGLLTAVLSGAGEAPAHGAPQDPPAG